MEFNKYIASNDYINFEIDDMKFCIQEMTTGEEADFFNYYLNNDGTINHFKLRMVQATKMVEHPFIQEWVNHVFDTFYPNYIYK